MTRRDGPRPSSARRGDRRRIIGPGHTFGSVTDKISSIVLTRKTPRGWFIGFGDLVRCC